MESLLGDTNAKVGREDVFKTTIENKSLHEIVKDNGIRVVKFDTKKSLIVKSTTHIATLINILGLLLMGKHTFKLITSFT
jgi:hypothetical protein